MSEIKIHCAYDKLVPIDEIKLNPKNRNNHPKEQIDRLIKIIKYNGVRRCLTVSNQSGLLVVGHGRIEAMKQLGMTHAPVNFQDYDNPENEYADSVADNAIGLWSELDLAGINSDLGDLGPDLDIDVLDIKDFVIDPSEINMPDLPSGDKSEFEQITFTLHSSQAMEVKSAMEIAKKMGPFTDELNENSNGNAITRICEVFVAKQE